MEATIEKKLKNLIKEKYGSVRQFSEQEKIPYSTIDSILKRGVLKANISNILIVTKALHISTEALIDSEIREKNDDPIEMHYEFASEYAVKMMELMEHLNKDGKNKLIDYADDLVQSNKYKNE